VVIDTTVYSARFGRRRGHRLASKYQAVLEGRTAIVSFVTVAEIRFGAQIANWTAAGTHHPYAGARCYWAVRMTKASMFSS
jgi:hypothetical protein